MNSIAMVHRDEPVALRITTGVLDESIEDQTIFLISKPNASGIRSIRRNLEEPYLGKILGIITIDLEGEMLNGIFLGSQQIRVKDENIRVGERLGLQSCLKLNQAWHTRPVISITVVE